MLYLFLMVFIASFWGCPARSRNISTAIAPRPVQIASMKLDQSPHTENHFMEKTEEHKKEESSAGGSEKQNIQKDQHLESPREITVSRPSSLPKTSPIFEKAIEQYEALHFEQAIELFLTVAQDASLHQDLRAQAFFFIGVCKYIVGEEFLSYFEQAKTLAIEFKPEPLEFKPELIEIYEQCRKNE